MSTQMTFQQAINRLTRIENDSLRGAEQARQRGIQLRQVIEFLQIASQDEEPRNGISLGQEVIEYISGHSADRESISRLRDKLDARLGDHLRRAHSRAGPPSRSEELTREELTREELTNLNDLISCIGSKAVQENLAVENDTLPGLLDGSRGWSIETRDRFNQTWEKLGSLVARGEKPIPEGLTPAGWTRDQDGSEQDGSEQDGSEQDGSEQDGQDAGRTWAGQAPSCQVPSGQDGSNGINQDLVSEIMATEVGTGDLVRDNERPDAGGIPDIRRSLTLRENLEQIGIAAQSTSLAPGAIADLLINQGIYKSKRSDLAYRVGRTMRQNPGNFRKNNDGNTFTYVGPMRRRHHGPSSQGGET